MTATRDGLSSLLSAVASTEMDCDRQHHGSERCTCELGAAIMFIGNEPVKGKVHALRSCHPKRFRRFGLATCHSLLKGFLQWWDTSIGRPIAIIAYGSVHHVDVEAHFEKYVEEPGTLRAQQAIRK